MVELKDWKDISEDFTDTLILGNGASIAVHRDFNYKSLRDAALERGYITDEVQEVFDHLGTEDFELVLNMLWHAERVNKALGVEETVTKKAYEDVKEALVKSVRDLHCEYSVAEPHLPAIYEFMGRFKTVLSLNYDLIAYWALLKGNAQHGGYRFKDCFTDGKRLDPNWERLREPLGSLSETTLVFYPHGNLVLTANPIEGDRKVVREDEFEQLLDRILEAWERGEGFPLFVSEGEWRQKLRAIQRSGYLSTVYSSVMSDLKTTATVYGWAMTGNDRHILDRVLRTPKKAIAVSVHKPTVKDLDRHRRRITSAITDSTNRMHTPMPKIEFFDAESAGCWINP